MRWFARKNQALGIVVGIVIGLSTAWYGFQQSRRAPLLEREIATRVLAEYIAKTVKPRAVLVVSNPYTETEARTGEAYRFEKAGEAGLRKGFGSQIDVKVGFAKLKPEALRDVSSIFVPPNATTPLSYLVTETAFDDLVREHPECDVIVSLIGLPANTTSAAFWVKSGSPRVALLLPDFSVLGDVNLIRHAFKSGKLVGAVIAKPGVSSPQTAITSDYKTEFEKRFILITAANIDENLQLLLR